jgi:predicted nucleotidyltransferase
MEQQIVDEIMELCDNHDVFPLCARQRGSRMLNASHDESDYDVMFLFVQDPSKMYRLGEATKSIENHHTGPDGKIDVSGWDIRKYGQHLADSNPTAVEFALAGEPYMEWYADEWDALQHDVRENVNLMALYHHYISMAVANYEKYIAGEEESDGNRQFHVGRATLMAAHIRINNSPPPMDIETLLADESLPFDLMFRVSYLLRQRRMNNGDFSDHDRIGDAFHEEREQEMEPTDERIKSPSQDKIDAAIEAALKEYGRSETLLCRM